jgi:hypothetical protein
MEQLEFHDPTALPGREWIEVEPRIHEMILNEDKTTGRRTLLQRHQPGSLNANKSLHDYIEEIYIVKGDLIDKTANETYEAGFYAYRKPGMIHGPFASATGCLMFITCTPVGQ